MDYRVITKVGAVVYYMVLVSEFLRDLWAEPKLLAFMAFCTICLLTFCMDNNGNPQ